MWVYLMKSKDEELPMFKNLHKMIETMFDRKIEVLCFNNDGEYIYKDFHSYLSDNGIESQASCTYYIKQDRVV